MNISRYTDVESLTLKLQFITPAFLGGADGNAELRSASFKGLLRYWWRILYSAKYLERDSKTGEFNNALKQKEAEIFGASGAKDSKNGRSCVTITVIPQTVLSKADNKVGLKDNDRGVLKYLSYGHKETWLPTSTVFSITITAQKEYVEEVFQAVLCLIEYGGIGSKSRNGFGSMKILEKESTVSPVPVLNKNFWCVHKQPVGFSALSENSHLYRSRNVYQRWEDALYELGEIYIELRKNIKKQGLIDQREFIAQPFKGCRLVKHNVNRLPKYMILHVVEDSHGFYGRILILPIDFDKACSQKKSFANSYKSVVENIHTTLAGKLTDITASIKGGRMYGA